MKQTWEIDILRSFAAHPNGAASNEDVYETVRTLRLITEAQDEPQFGHPHAYHNAMRSNFSVLCAKGDLEKLAQGSHKITPQGGRRIGQPPIVLPVMDPAVVLLRKYGSGGEGEDHRELKGWIAQHPRVIGLTNVSGVTVERQFISGDAVDLVFEHGPGAYTVVEIETTTPLPGAHQAIKYRALLCAEKRFPLDSESVRTIVVAWSIPSHVKRFCADYRVEFREYRKPALTERVGTVRSAL